MGITSYNLANLAKLACQPDKLGYSVGMKRNERKRRLLRPGEAADRLGVTTQTIRTYARSGGPLADAVVYLPGSNQARFVAAKVDALIRKTTRRSA